MQADNVATLGGQGGEVRLVFPTEDGLNAFIDTLVDNAPFPVRRPGDRRTAAVNPSGVVIDATPVVVDEESAEDLEKDWVVL